jgi:hypothetical protein
MSLQSRGAEVALSQKSKHRGQQNPSFLEVGMIAFYSPTCSTRNVGQTYIRNFDFQQLK